MEGSNEKLSVLEFKIQNALMYLNQANKILHEPTRKKPRSGCVGKNQFTQKQLKYIRDTFVCMIKERTTCNYSELSEKAIARLNIKDLKIINVCQKGIGCTEFEDMDSFLKCGNIDN